MSLYTSVIPILVGSFLLTLGAAVLWERIQARRIPFGDQSRHAEKVLTVFLIIAATDMTIFLTYVWMAGRY